MFFWGSDCNINPPPGIEAVAVDMQNWYPL